MALNNQKGIHTKRVNVTWQPQHTRSEHLVSRSIVMERSPQERKESSQNALKREIPPTRVSRDSLFIPTPSRWVKTWGFMPDRPRSKRASWLRVRLSSFRIPELPPKKWQVVIFVTLVLFTTVPLYAVSFFESLERERTYYLGEAERGLELWRAGYASVERGEFTESTRHFENAQGRFARIQASFRSRHPFLERLAAISPVLPKRYEAFVSGIESARAASTIGVTVTSLFNTLKTHDSPFTEERVASALYELEAVSSMGHDISRMLSSIDPRVLPKAYRVPFTTLQHSLPSIVRELETLRDLLYLTARLAGFTDGPQHVLLAFQNNAELRGSGGFFGSYGLIMVDKGNITIRDMPGGGTYDFQGSFRETVVSPLPLHLINPVWQFQDANWWPDWPTSARKIAWFYEHGNGATVDAVIGMTPTFIERLLNLVGPIDLTEEYGVVVDKYNFYDVIQMLAEQKAEQTLKPKAIIGTLAVRLLERLFTVENGNYQPLMSLLLDSVSEKQLLVYASDNGDEALLKRVGWDGGVKETSGDYLMIAHSNIAGGKSDRDIKDRTELVSTVSPDGTITNTLTLTRTHHGHEGVGFGGVRNVDYLRVYVPSGSRLVHAVGFEAPPEALFERPPEGFRDDEDYTTLERTVREDSVSGTEIMESFGKTVFANWLMVDPGESATVEVTYVLPTKMDTQEDYQLFVQKQPGFIGSSLKYDLAVGDGWYIKKDGSSNERKITVNEITDRDIAIDLTIKKQSYASLETGTR